MSSLPATFWTTGTTEIFRTGTWRAAMPQYRDAPSPCRIACPVGGEIATWIGQARSREWKRAWETLTRNNPFPAVTGRICHHPCEAACNRGSFDEAIAVCALERSIGDRALAEGWRFPQTPSARRERIAVIGGGPSGLSAAYQLRRRGYAVTLFEAKSALGGLLRHGIPPYRLPRNVLDGEIERVLDLGIDVRLDAPVSTQDEWTRLRSQHDAIYLAVGASRPKRLPQLNYDADFVMDGAAYLEQSNAGRPPALGRRLAVLGGGSAAMDVARSARRAGHEVTVISLEAEAQMPAQREELVQALEEGITLVAGAMLRAAAATAHGVHIDCVRVGFEAGAQPGLFTVTPLPGSDFRLVVDGIIPAIGQDPEFAAMARDIASEGALVRIDSRHATSLAGVYAGGDAASTARFVSHAIGAGKEVARQIDCYLQGEVAREPAGANVVAPGAINHFYYPRAARAAPGRLSAAQRGSGQDEVQAALSPDQFDAEAARCFSCGTCIECDNCFHHCPDLAVRRVPGGYEILEAYCKGCGLCVAECPTGSIAMQEENK